MNHQNHTAAAAHGPSLMALLVLFLAWLLSGPDLSARMDRIPLHDQELFLSGSNVAWIHFGRDIGPGPTRLDQFDQMFQELRAAGGNSMRLWLHTDGRSTPEWNGHDVVGPGVGAIEDLRNILDVAYRNNVTLMLCLWSFDMLRISHGQTVTDRAFAILTEPNKRQLYLENALVPMVEALREHPAILAWEIFNEAEGMSEEFGWNFNRHVPMSDIQAFVGLAAAAIKQADPTAKVTTGAWSFLALTDILGDTHSMNYYRDDRLRMASGQRHGTLDFYTVHYYTWAGTRLSPFHHHVDHWQLDKPVVVAEFYAKEDIFGVSRFGLYQTLYDRGYAGALGWQWVDHAQNRDNNFDSWPNMLVTMQALAQAHPGDVLLAYPRIPKQALVHHWKLDDPPVWSAAGRAPLLDSADASARAAVVHGPEAALPPSFRKPGATDWTGNSIYLGGADNRVELGPVAPRERPFTMAFWYKLHRIETQTALLSAPGQGSGAGSWGLFLDGTERELATGRPRLLFSQAGGLEVSLAPRIEANRWYHLALTRSSDSQENFRIYLDGVEVHRSTNHLDFVNSAAGVILGQGFDGGIDDVRLYNEAVEHIGMLWGDGYSRWARTFFGDRFGVMGTRLRDDFNGDTWSNFHKYLSAESPAESSGQPSLISGVWMHTEGDARPLELEFTLRSDPALPFSIQTTTDLIHWTDHLFRFDGSHWAFEDPDFGTMTEVSRKNDLSLLRARIPATEADRSKQFFRLNIPLPE